MKRFGVLSFLFLAVVLIKIEAQVEKEWWKHATFYQIYPRSLMDSDADGIGDLRGNRNIEKFNSTFRTSAIWLPTGIISKMEHLKEIGMDACWLSPIFASPQVDTSTFFP